MLGYVLQSGSDNTAPQTFALTSLIAAKCDRRIESGPRAVEVPR